MEKISLRHAISIGVLFSLGSLIISLGMNNTYTWQMLIISFVLAILVLIMYQKLLNKYPNLNLFEIIKLKYNNIIGNIIIILYLFMLTYNSVVIIYSFIDFITTINQSDFLSKELIMLINMLLLGYVLKTTLINIARFSQCCFVTIIFMIIILFIAGMSDIEFNNLLPIVTKNIDFNNTLNLLVQPFIELTLLYNIFCKLKINQKSKKYVFLIVSFITLIILLIITIESIGLLGDEYYSFLNFPYYSAISCINMNKIVIKIESLCLIIFYFTSFIKLIFTIYNFVLGFNLITNTKKKYYFPYILFIHVLSFIMFDNIYELMELKKYYTFIFFVLSLFVPFLINIKKNNSENKNIM